MELLDRLIQLDLRRIVPLLMELIPGAKVTLNAF